MKDYTVNIIDYRGGKALLVDSFDIMRMTTRMKDDEAIKIIEEHYDQVDYVLLLTSMPFYTLRPKIRALFTQPHRSEVNCFRHITLKGKETLKAFMEEQAQEIEAILKDNTKEEEKQ